MPAPRVRTSVDDGRLLALDPTGPPWGNGEPVEPTATFPTVGPPLRHDAAPDLGRAVYTPRDELVCVGRGGDVLWRLALGSSNDHVSHVVEAATGRVLGSLPGVCRHKNAQVLGDGTWLFQGRRHSG